MERAEAECGNAGRVVPRVNGLALYHPVSAAVATARGRVTSNLVSGLGERTIDASWEVLCIKDEAQIISFTVHSVGQDKAKETSGFTASFRQRGHPEILRLKGEPTDLALEDKQLLDVWSKPSVSDRLVVVSRGSANNLEHILEDKFRQLDDLKAKAFDLRQTIHERQREIDRLIKQDFRQLTSALKSCRGIKCVFKTTLRKVPQIAHSISNRFRRPQPKELKLDGGIHKQGDDCLMYFDENQCDEKHTDVFVNLLEVGSLQAPTNENEEPHSPPTLPPDIHQSAPPSRPETEVPSEQGPPSDHDMSPPSNHGPPPTNHGPPPHHENSPPPNHPPPPHRHDEMGPPRHRHGGPNGFPVTHFDHHHHHGPPPIVKAIILCVILFTIAAFTFRFVRIRTSIFRNPTRRADRACRREERRNRCTHRRAAAQHRLTQLWSRYRRASNSDDYDEKRALILEQEGVLEDAMQGELQTLRSAQEIVDDLYSAEEGRSRLYHQANRPRAPAAELDAEGSSSATHARIDSLPMYGLPPPRYEEELEGDMTVVDGFQYSPSTTTADDTPDSSVVDCSPRMSCDTGRTTITRNSQA